VEKTHEVSSATVINKVLPDSNHFNYPLIDLKMLACASYCFVVSILGVIILLLLGLGLSYDYEFIKTHNRPSHANGCFWGAGVYVITGAICLVYMMVKRKKDSKPEAETKQSDV
jgi:hypothetical protein